MSNFFIPPWFRRKPKVNTGSHLLVQWLLDREILGSWLVNQVSPILEFTYVKLIHKGVPSHMLSSYEFDDLQYVLWQDASVAWKIWRSQHDPKNKTDFFEI